MGDKITETGPLGFRQLTSAIKDSYIYPKNDRLDWVNSHQDLLKGRDASIGMNGLFTDKGVERLYRNGRFVDLFKDAPELESYKKLPSAQRDRMYANHYSYLKGRDAAIQAEAEEAKRKEWYRGQMAVNPAAIRQTMEGTRYYFDDNVGQMVLGDYTQYKPKAVKEGEAKAKQYSDAARDRYLTDYDGSKRANDVKTIKDLAPQLSNSYAELIGEDFSADDIDWEGLSPWLMTYLENGEDISATKIFNAAVNRALSDNQSFGEAALNWGTRFVADVGLMAVDLAGMVEGIGESLIGDIAIPLFSGEKIDWAQAGATILYDNYLGNLANEASESLREDLPIYTNQGVNQGLLLDPESAAFTASMIIPGGLVTKGSKIAKLTKAGKSYKRAGKELQGVLNDVNNAHFRTLTNLGNEAKYSALREGKSLSQATVEAREVQQMALTDIYRRGKIQRAQIRLSSALEAQQEALNTKKGILDQYEQAWNKKVQDLTQDVLSGKVDISDWEYNLADAERWQNELFNNPDYMMQLTEAMRTMAAEQGIELSDADAIHYMNEWIQQEAITRAKLDARASKERKDYDKLGNDQANLGGIFTFANDYCLLRFSEGFGGWTTRIPTYNRMSAIAKDTRSFGTRAKEALGGLTSFNSKASNMASRIGFDATGKAIRRTTPKSILQATAKIGGTLGTENAQEVLQEGIASGSEGTAVWNAEEFLNNHFSGNGSEVVNDDYQTHLLSFLQHAYHGRSWDDIAQIVKATSIQMILGTPSISKYGSFSVRKDANGRFVDDNIRRGVNEGALSYYFRKLNAWAPLNSPTAQSITEVLNTNSDVNTFINTYNALLDDSRAYSNYASSSLNYAARAFDAAARGDETDYEHSKFAAQVAEAAFIAQVKGKNQQTKLTAYQNLADINTKREGESEEDFQARRANTLKELREEASYNSLKNASDEEVSTWAEANGKQMLNLIKKASNKSAQLYEQYDGNISWEQMYATLYDDALIEFSNNNIKNIEDSLKQLSTKLTNTTLTPEDLKDSKGKPIQILTESEIMNLNPAARQNLINNATGKQKEIVDSLLNQLETENVSLGLGRNVKNDFERSAREYKIVQDASREIASIINNPKAFLNNIAKGKERAAAMHIFKKVADILGDDGLTNNVKRKLISDELRASEGVLSRENYSILAAALEQNPLFSKYAEQDRKLNRFFLASMTKDFDRFNDVEKAKAYATAMFLDENDIDWLDNEASVSYINQHVQKFQKFLGEEADMANYIQKYNEVLELYKRLVINKTSQEESEKSLEEALTNPKPVVDDTKPAVEETTPEPAEEAPATTETPSQQIPPTAPEKEFDMSEDEDYLEYAKRVVPAEYHPFIDILNNYGENLIMPFTMMVKSTLSAEVLRLDTEDSRVMLNEIKESLRQMLEELTSEDRGSIFEYLSTALNLIVNQYPYLNRPAPLEFLQKALNAVSDTDENTVNSNYTAEMQKTLNATATRMTMANVVQVINSVLGTQYVHYGVEDFLFHTQDKYLTQLRQDKNTKVQYIILGQDVRTQINDSMGNNYIPERDLPIAAVVEIDATEAERIKEEAKNSGEEKNFIEIKDGETTHYYQPIGFLISSSSDALGGNMARIIRQTAINQVGNNASVIKHEGEALYTTGVTLKGNSPFSKRPNNLKSLIQQAISTSGNSFWDRFVKGLKMMAQEDASNVAQEGKNSLYFTFYNGKRGNVGNESKMQIIVKNLYECINRAGKTLRDVIFDGTVDEFINFHQRENGTQGRMYKAIKAVTDVANSLEGQELIYDESNKDRGKAAKERINKIWSAFKEYIYLDDNKFPFKTKLDSENNTYVYVEVTNERGKTREVKLFPVRNADGASIKMEQVASSLKEAMKDPAMGQYMHFQLDYWKATGTQKETKNSKVAEIYNQAKALEDAKNYMKEVMEDDIAVIRAYSLSPTFLPETYMTNGTYIQEQAKEFGALDRATETTQERQIEREDAEGSPEATTDPEIVSNSENTSKPTKQVETSEEINEDAETDADSLGEDEFEDLRETSEKPELLWNREKELAWLSKALPQLSRNDLIKFQEGLIRIRKSGKTAWGKFDGAMMILSNLAAEGTVYHEAFHVVFQAVLDEGERVEILEEAKLKYGEELDEKALEEQMAEDFREYVSSHEKSNWLGKLKNFFDELLTKVIYWTTGRNKIDMLYQNINKGNYSKRELNLRKAENEVNIRENDLQIEFDETGEFKTVESFMNALLETILGYRDEHLARLLSRNIDDVGKFETALREGLASWNNNLERAIANISTASVSTAANTAQNQKILDALTKYENNEKLTRVENKLISKLIEKARKENNLDWINTEKARLQNEININNSDRIARLDSLRHMLARQSMSTNQDYINSIRETLVNQRENIANKKFYTAEIASNLASKKVAKEVKNIRLNFNGRTALGNQSKEVVSKLKTKGLNLIEYQSMPVEVQERIKLCCRF